MVPIFKLTLDVPNAKRLDIAFAGLAAEIKDWTDLWPAVIDQIEKAEERAFSTQGALTEHGEWAPLSPDYAKAKRKKYGDQMIETASSRMRDSLTGHTGETIEELEPLRMRFGTSVPYAVWQQMGTKKMPARRLLDLTEEDLALIRKQVQRVALNKATRLGFAAGARTGQGDMSRPEATALGRSILTGETPSPFETTVTFP